MAENTLMVEAEADGDVLMPVHRSGRRRRLRAVHRLPDPVARACSAASTRSDLTATTTLSLVLPAGWDCLANGPVTGRPPAGRAGPVAVRPGGGTRPFDMTIAAGPYVQAWQRHGRDGPARCG